MNALPPAFSSARRRARCLVLSLKPVLLLAVILLLSSTAMYAQSNRPGLIAQAVDESELVTLAGNTHPLATLAADRGAVPASTAEDRMLLVLRRSPEQEQALNMLVESLHDPNSPNFHQWLTPAQFGAQWGAVDSDITAVTAWLQSHGFAVKGASEGRTVIEFSGTAGQVQEAFHTAIHLYEVNGEIHHANASDPQIPAALAPVIAGVARLNDFYPKSTVKKGPRGIYDSAAGKIRPDFTAPESPYNVLFVGPADAATIYNSPNKALNPWATGTTYDGTGAVIGIIGDSNITTSVNASYRSLFGLAANTPMVKLDGTDPGETKDALEAYLDTEIANGIAPNAKLYLYIAASTGSTFGGDIAAVKALDDNLVDVLNLSFGECEAGLGTSGNEFYATLWEQAAAQGISVTVSTGDSGSAGCDDPDPTVETQAKYGLQINGLASTPYDTAVGGTDFAALIGPDGSGSDFTKYASTTNNAKTLRSALGYIPEVPWDDSTIAYPPGPISTNIALTGEYANIAAGSGGKSSCAVGSIDSHGNITCTSGYAKPSWQSAPGVPTDGVRDIPDVSFFASDGLLYNATWAICTDLEKVGSSPITECVPGADGLPDGEFYIQGVGGTSAAAPTLAGILALVRQKTGERQGVANYAFYNLARTSPGVFHDVTTGNNSVSCKSGTPNCNNYGGNYFLSGYNAGTGYDLATGLGSINVSSLLSKWASAGLSPTATRLTISPVSLEHGAIATADATVTSANGFESGAVTLTASVKAPENPLLGTFPIDTSGSTGSLKLNSLPGGSYSVVASYGGSTQDAKSVSAPVNVNVTAEPSKTALTIAATNPTSGAPWTTGTTPYGYPFTITAHPYGVNSPVVSGVVVPDGDATGSVKFTRGSAALATVTLASDGLAALTNYFPSPGSNTIEAAYGGDPSFKASSDSISFGVVKATTELKLSVNETKYDGKPFVFTAAVSTNSVGAPPTGEVELKVGSKVVAEGSLVGEGATKTARASAMATISTLDLPTSRSNVVAVYVGDANYDGSTSSAVSVTGRPSFVLSNISVRLPAEHSTAAPPILTTSEGGYAGTINYTCKLTTKTTTAAPPECSMYPATATLAAGGTAGPLMLIFGKGTKLPTSTTTSSNARWFGAGSAVLALSLLFGIPARRRGWRSMLSAILLLISVAGFSACSSSAKMITSGTYTFTVTGTDSKDSTLTSTATVSVEVL
ncbi:protease pro-enzyme activation domain-containing protein [Acidicapsa acidisoli]|uniref:protease pro-enzyme activation domain-containing protein n=1 Tax=Acidicapsa acidisoli TaxID=1615681 RepID=UPI0021E0D219|nr:protease pro-enzyme activation domain-containing protein [Acidicapsa acidisoli]